jgi:hypothetical protein
MVDNEVAQHGVAIMDHSREAELVNRKNKNGSFQHIFSVCVSVEIVYFGFRMLLLLLVLLMVVLNQLHHHQAM